MDHLNLQPNEGIIIQSDGVLHGGRMASYTDELVLTNLNVIYISKGIFGKVKAIQKYPVNQIKVINGQTQAIMGKNANNGSLQLQIFLKNGQEESFEFQTSERKEISNWINGISQLLTGNSSPSASKNVMAIPGTEQVAGMIRDTIGAFRDTLGINSKKNAASEYVTAKCIGCGAPISGAKGQIVRCRYCDTDQTL